MRVLVACEFSGIVRDAFIARGHDAISCDLLPTERPGPHIQGDVTPLLREPWDLVIAHPPCMYLTRARGVIDLGGIAAGAAFFLECLNANAPAAAVENPAYLFRAAHAILGRPDCIVEPHHFGDFRQKKTGFWLRNLPPLMPEMVMVGAEPYIVKRTGGSKNRSRFHPGMARAMAHQWGNL